MWYDSFENVHNKDKYANVAKKISFSQLSKVYKGFDLEKINLWSIDNPRIF